MRLQNFLTEMADDPEDWGKAGRGFEKTFTMACDMLNLKYEKNSFSGRIWDIKPTGSGWERMIANKDVNIKSGGTKWMFSSSELYRDLPWENKPKDFDEEAAAELVKKTLKKFGINKTVFLKPKSKELQNEIEDAVNTGDVHRLDGLFQAKNFYAEMLGNNYDVRVRTDGERVTSIAIDKDGKVFMRSEKPRKLGAGGTITVTFRTPTPKIGKVERKIKV